MMKVKLLLCFLLFPCLLQAMDFGLILDQNADYGGYGGEGSSTYSGSLIPRLSFLLGDRGELYLSAGIEAAYNDGWTLLPELLRTELSLYFGSAELRAGRMYYVDPLGFIAEGLFDGARVAFESEAGAFSAGAWYTGFLYKRRADIIMTAGEYESYAAGFDFNDFQNTYFAPRRFVAALGWEHLGRPVKTRFSLIGQADLSGGFDFSGEGLLHSQYAVGKISVPGRIFAFDLGGCVEMIQEGGENGIAFAGEAAFTLTPPLRLANRLSILACYTSPSNDRLAAFLPLTTETQGEIFKVMLSGLSLVSADYVIAFHPSFSFGLTSTYFIRSDLKTYRAYPLSGEGSDKYLLGNEFFGRFLWSPASDVQINLGGGVFLPSLGDAAPKADPSWRAELNVILSLH